MSDIRISAAGFDIPFDLSMAGADLAMDDGLQTALIISLFTDKRAPDDVALPQPGADRRGFWGDAYAEIQGDQTGSLLWTLGRSKQTPDVLVSAQGYAQEALGWLVEDGVASAVSVATSYPKREWMLLAIDVDRPAGQGREHFDFLWRAP